MIVGERQIHHVPDGDGVTAQGVGDHHGPLHQRTGAEDRHLRQVDDRGVEKGPRRAVVGDGEGAAAQFVGADLPSAGARRQVTDALGKPGQVQVPGVMNHRHHQTAIGVHGNADVLLRCIGHRTRFEIG